jgi:hypothetical protein
VPARRLPPITVGQLCMPCSGTPQARGTLIATDHELRPTSGTPHADPRRLDQRVRGRGLKPLVRCHGRVLAPDRDARPASPPASQARRHSHTDLALTRSRAAISPVGSRCSNISAACNRTRSRAARARAVRPPPSAYLMTPA